VGDPDADRARKRAGVVVASELAPQAARTAVRRGLVRVQPGAWVAATQPVDAEVLLSAVREALGDQEHAFLGPTALWLHGVAPPPQVVEVGVPHAHRAALDPPVRTRRVVASVLRGTRMRQGFSVVALEVAVVQVAAFRRHDQVRALLEELLRGRRTSVVALRSRCRRGLRGSAAIRCALDELVGTSLDGAVRDLRRELTARGVSGLRSEVHFTNASGASCYADLLHEASGTVVEVDGYQSHTERARFRADRRRDRWLLREHGLVTVRIDVAELVEDLPRVVEELLPLLRRTAA
jgi:very-short-patch-repair endonuclease